MLKKYKEQLKNKNKNEIYIRVKIYPKAKNNKIKEILDDGTIKIDISVMPVNGKANIELIKFLSKEFDVLKNNIKIISGFKSSVKLIKIYAFL